MLRNIVVKYGLQLQYNNYTCENFTFFLCPKYNKLIKSDYLSNIGHILILSLLLYSRL